MAKIIGYKGACKGCGWVFKENTEPKIDNMPAECEKCKGNMEVMPIFEEDGRGLTYEFTIFCKENGVTVRDGLVLSDVDVKELSRDKLVHKFQLAATEAFIRMIGASGEAKDEKNVQRLLSRR